MTLTPQSPWCRIIDACAYLDFKEDAVYARLVESEKPIDGKIRYRAMRDSSQRRKLRLWKADVLKMLEPFEI